MTTTEIKLLLHQIGDGLELLADRMQLPYERGSIKKVVQLQFVNFLMYLSASDGEISWRESSFLSELLDVQLTPATVGDFIRQNNIYSTDYEREVPIALQMYVAAENVLHDIGENVSVSNTLIMMYKEVGNAFIQLDGEINSNALQDFHTYIDMMENYRQANLKTSLGGAKGFVKTGSQGSKAPGNGDTAASNLTSNGVAAPKKGQ